MRYDIAQSILQCTMKDVWDLSKEDDETRDIQIISEIKYDDYQQYTHGMRYVESLALWMRQFDNKEDRELAYRMIKEQLIFISEEEMRQLIACVFPIIMNRYLLDKTKRFCDENDILKQEDRREICKFYTRCSLFLGLSDGAHMDYFRRQNKELSNEQVFIHYDYSDEKAKEMKEALKKDAIIKHITKKYGMTFSPSFSSYFLIDDFTGSGKSYIRKEGDKWHGKIKHFLNNIDKEQNYDLHIIIYIATQEALDLIKKHVQEYTADKENICITVDTLQKVNSIDWNDNKQLLDLLRRNYKEYKTKENSYEDKHFSVGNGKEPYLGFADCSLPLVLYHNTPNNTLPIIWYSLDEKAEALFPRVTRHKET